MAPFGLKLWENAFQTIPNISFFDAEKNFLAKIFDENFRQKKIRRKIDKLPVFAELWIFGRNRQMRLEKLPPKFWFSALYDFWQRNIRRTRKLPPAHFYLGSIGSVDGRRTVVAGRQTADGRSSDGRPAGRPGGKRVVSGAEKKII